MVQSNTIVFGWNRAVVGREGMAGELFAHTVSWLDRAKTMGTIESWEPCLLTSHGGDLNGFFMIKGTGQQLTSLKCNDEWTDIVLRAGQYLTNVGVIEAFTGPQVQDVMSRWTKSIPTR